MASDELELLKSDLTEINGRAKAINTLTPANELVPNGTDPLPLIEDDEDLVPLIRQASNEELEPLVEYIISKGGITTELHRTRAYKQYSPSRNHRMYADDIAAEIQKFGANTPWSQTFRNGRGKKYRKILGSVAKRCGIKSCFWHETAELEKRVLVAVITKAYEGMAQEERQEMLENLQIHKLPGISGPLAAGTLQAAIQAAGFAPYKLAVIVANSTANSVLGHGLAFATNAGLTKGLALFAGPIGWALDAIWGGIIVAGPAYRVSIPCVVQVALIRQSMLRRQRARRSRILRTIGIVTLLALASVVVLLAARSFMR